MTALILNENASAECVESYLDSFMLASVMHNVVGEVEFKRNELGPLAQRIFVVDGISKKPTHDVENPVLLSNPFTAKPSAKSRSQVYDWLRSVSEGERNAFLDNPPPGGFWAKNCGWCDQSEFIAEDFFGTVEGAKKYGYCKVCKQVCYCSKECQLADWPDHQLLCHFLAKEGKEGNEPSGLLKLKNLLTTSVQSNASLKQLGRF